MSHQCPFRISLPIAAVRWRSRLFHVKQRRGSIDFDLPEAVIEFDDEQRMTNISRSERNIAHRIIEEFMLAANRAVAHYLLKRAIRALHRVHEKPDPKKTLAMILDLRQFAVPGLRRHAQDRALINPRVARNDPICFARLQ